MLGILNDDWLHFFSLYWRKLKVTQIKVNFYLISTQFSNSPINKYKFPFLRPFFSIVWNLRRYK